MNTFEELIEQVRLSFPQAKIEISSPELVNGEYWIDITNKKIHIPIAWRKNDGFEFQIPTSSNFKKLNEKIMTSEQAFNYIKELMSEE